MGLREIEIRLLLIKLNFQRVWLIGYANLYGINISHKTGFKSQTAIETGASEKSQD